MINNEKIKDIDIYLEGLENKIDEIDINTLRDLLNNNSIEKGDYLTVRKYLRKIKIDKVNNPIVKDLWYREFNVLLMYSYIVLPKSPNGEISYTDDILKLYDDNENIGDLQSFLNIVNILKDMSYSDATNWIKEEKKKLNNNIETKKKQ